MNRSKTAKAVAAASGNWRVLSWAWLFPDYTGLIQSYVKLRAAHGSDHFSEEGIIRTQDQVRLTAGDFYIANHVDEVLDELVDG